MSQTLHASAFLDKGGTGKTTATAHLGVALDRERLDVLLVDLAGKQGDLAKTFGVWDQYREQIQADEAWLNVATVFQTSGRPSPTNLATKRSRTWFSQLAKGLT